MHIYYIFVISFFKNDTNLIFTQCEIFANIKTCIIFFRDNVSVLCVEITIYEYIIIRVTVQTNAKLKGKIKFSVKNEKL